MITLKSSICVTVRIALLCLLSVVATAEEAAPPPQLYSVYEIEIKPGKQAQFIAWAAFSPIMGAGNRIVIASGFTSFAELAPQQVNLMVQAFGEEEAARLAGLAQESMAGSVRSTIVFRPDLSRPAPPRDTPSQLVYRVRVTIKPGTAAQYEEFVLKIVEAAEKNGDPGYWSAYSGSIAADNTYLVRVPFWSWEELDTAATPIPAMLEKAFGKREANRLLKLANDATVHSESSLYSARPDLSYTPAAD